MKIKWTTFAPVGVDGQREIKWLTAGLGLAVVWSVFVFGIQYVRSLSELYYHGIFRNGQLIPGARMENFSQLIVNCDVLFALICLVMPALAAYHYWYHYQGSKSIYLMQRLPDKWELHRRCLAIPTAGVVISLALLGLLGMLFYMIYILCTPAQCLPV